MVACLQNQGIVLEENGVLQIVKELKDHYNLFRI